MIARRSVDLVSSADGVLHLVAAGEGNEAEKRRQ
jgi:hypothetical protein